MESTIETMKFVAELARSGGMMEERNTSLNSELHQLRARIEELEQQLSARENTIVEKDRRITELEVMLERSGQQPTVVVNQYFMLSMPKTVNYVNTLDNSGRRFVSHFMHHTLPDGTPLSVIEQVDEMTSLRVDETKRLAEAMEKVAEREPMSVAGDMVVTKHVENKVGSVEAGGTGFSMNENQNQNDNQNENEK